MGIQKCKSCRYQFTWKEVQKAIRWTYKPLVCNKCGTKHVVTKKTRYFFDIPLPILGGVVVVAVSNTLVIPVILLFSIFIIAISFFPYVANYKIKEDNNSM
ncbi:TIGR04104 family putative zinc finger protein [Halobacillus litoralis]|uniref:TIGR04104 family putative zinc finger protein n=1 Tax=Halobacillus litoralis TaxID=45668 RepID=UPI001CFDF154